MGSSGGSSGGGGGGGLVFRESAYETHFWQDPADLSIDGDFSLTARLTDFDDSASPGDATLDTSIAFNSQVVLNVSGLWRFKYDLAVTGAGAEPYGFHGGFATPGGGFGGGPSLSVNVIDQQGPGVSSVYSGPGVISFEGMFFAPTGALLSLNMFLANGPWPLTANELTLAVIAEL